MPKLPAVNPNITVMMMGEKAADLIKESAVALEEPAGPPVIDPPEITAFLRRTAPFDSLSPEELERLAEDAVVLDLAADEVVVESTARATEEIWVVYQGQVHLWAVDDDVTGEPLETVNPGGIFGFSSLLTGERPQFTARMHGPGILVRLQGRNARPVFSRPAGVSYLAGLVSAGLRQPRSPFEAVLGRRPVGRSCTPTRSWSRVRPRSATPSDR